MKIRLYIPNINNEKLSLSKEHSHYIIKVMRQKIGDNINIFNKEDGEFLCKIIDTSQNICTLICEKQMQVFQKPTKEIMCVFSIVKQKNIELIIEKCTEIGVQYFLPIITARTNVVDIKISRLNKIAIESSEQCGRVDIPEIFHPIKLKDLPKNLQNFHPILLHQNGNSIHIDYEKIAVIAGPEGGFTNEEMQFLETFSQKVKISQNILRAETANIIGCALFL